ncbi:YhcG family protein [Fibrobacter sp. UWH9]|uniref:PDDEXK nuclease domain-containing protein n=1 Tax=Fibrobacter sp. UWH9 TaxID=1896213 RepID=UPI0009347D63|nr:PDDEXK nuclease domain-containing protein [Fibrobacter sp. UWH9]
MMKKSVQSFLLDKKFVADIKKIINAGRSAAYASVNSAMMETYWNIGKRIVEQEQNGKTRADYGKQIIDSLAKELTEAFGNGFSSRYLRSFRKFYQVFPDAEIWKSRFPNLTWTHYLKVLRVDNDVACRWYIENASKEMWSVRVLDRNISTQYFERHFKAPQVSDDATKDNPSKLEILKNPFVAEFLGFKTGDDFSETDLESAIISHLKEFLLEMGRGFAFVARQQHIHTDSDDYYIDLVFYNIVLKCYVLIDLKIGKIKHQDVGQMDMYVRMYDELKRTEGDNSTIGIVLCSETDETIAKYSVLNDNDQLFAAKLMTYLPTEEELKIEIERQKEIFNMQHGK